MYLGYFVTTCDLDGSHWSVALMFAPARRRRSTVSKCSLQAAAKSGTWPSSVRDTACLAPMNWQGGGAGTKDFQTQVKHWQTASTAPRKLSLALCQQTQCSREHLAVGSLQTCAHSAQHIAGPYDGGCQKHPPCCSTQIQLCTTLQSGNLNEKKLNH